MVTIDQYATAAELGLMQGFPPPPDKRVNRSNALMPPPFNRWSYQRMRMIYPSAPIRMADVPAPVEVDVDDGIGQLQVPTPDGRSIDVATYLRESYSDSLVVVTPERIVFEAYLNGMHPLQPHQMMSVTKSFAGLFGLIVAADGALSEDDLVADVVPELGSGPKMMVRSWVLSMSHQSPRSVVRSILSAWGRLR